MREYWYTGGSTGTLYLFLTYVEVDLLSWGGRRHPDSWGNSLLLLLENNHRNKVFLDWTGVIIRTNAIGTLLQQYADFYSGVPVRKLLPWRTSTLLSWHYWLTDTPVRNYSGVLVQRYQYADYYSGIPVRLFLLWRTSHLYDTFLGG
jgi:hypothetical protein